MTNLYLVSFCFRYVQIGVASFGSIVDCGSKPGGFSRMTYDVMQWIRKVKVDSWQLKIELKQQKMDMEQNKVKMEQQKIRLELQKGVWCGYKGQWNTGNAKIPYDKLLHSSTNIENPGIGLDTLSGVFTVPVTGVWRVSFSLHSNVDTGQYNDVYIYHNQQKIQETWHLTHSEYYKVISTGGRELITRAEQGDTFHLGTETIDDGIYFITTCFEFVSL